MATPGKHATRRAINPDGAGDDFAFCATCAFASVCLAQGYDKTTLAELHCLIEHAGPYAAGTQLFALDQPFDAVFAVRAGAVKTFIVDDRGRQHVLGFFLPGELVGLDGLYPTVYPCTATALDTTTVCRFSFPAMATLATRMPGLQQQLFRLMSKNIAQASWLAGDFGADERLAAFLVNLADRCAARGFSATRFRLTMSRADIASYLRLATETVSRVLGRLQQEGLIAVERREVELRQPDRLRDLARSVLRSSR